MNAKIQEFLVQTLSASGPMDVGTFMTHVLGHPEHGYYSRQDPFGVQGDFITAPEISQMFGELIGAWVADQWIRLGQPNPFVLCEGGPGRGTLMADALRATKAVPGFHQVLQLHLMETSPALREMQKDNLGVYNPVWHETLDNVPDDMPVIFIANELLDALPLRQIEKRDDGWSERVIALNDNAFVFAHRPFPLSQGGVLPAVCDEAVPGDIYEFSPAREAFVSNVCQRIKKQKGAALFVDYGHTEPMLKDSFRAFKSHKPVHVLEHVGDADLTSDVDFAALANAAQKEGLDVIGPTTQGEFLESLGLFQRAETLKKNATDRQKEDIEKALHRLHDLSEMGSFKVIGFVHGG